MYYVNFLKAAGFLKLNSSRFKELRKLLVQVFLEAAGVNIVSQIPSYSFQLLSETY
jgi:hypothetical protein